MWDCYYAKEPMDYKLFWLRFLKRIWVVCVAVLLGAMIIGIPYYLVNVTFGEAPEYKIVSEYYLDYAEDSSGELYEYFNYYTWSEIVNTDEFIAILAKCLPDEISKDAGSLRAYTDATVESDTRYLYTTVSTDDPTQTVIYARAMEEAILIFADLQKEFHSARVLTSPSEGTKTYPDVRCERAVILGAVIGLFVGLLGVCIGLICDTSVHLPSTIEKRYKIKALGCLGFKETKNNIRYFIKSGEKVSLVFTDIYVKEETIALVEYIQESTQEVEVIVEEKEVLGEEFSFDALRTMDKVFLMIRAGSRNGRKIERLLEQLSRQDIVVSGAFLYQEDKKLIGRYYK